MPRQILTSTLVTRFQQRCDMVGDDSIARAEWLSYASEIYGEMLSEASALEFGLLEASTSISITGAASYAEPASHDSTVRVVQVLSDGTERELRELQQHEAADFAGRTGDAFGWLHIDNALQLLPSPTTGTYKWYYLAQPDDLSSNADGDNIDVLCPAGEAFLIWGVAVLAKAKGGKDVSLAMAQRERAREQLQLWAANRNQTDVRTRGPVADEDGPVDPGAWWPYR
jgi:hypothetical protein